MAIYRNLYIVIKRIVSKFMISTVYLINCVLIKKLYMYIRKIQIKNLKIDTIKTFYLKHYVANLSSQTFTSIINYQYCNVCNIMIFQYMIKLFLKNNLYILCLKFLR